MGDRIQVIQQGLANIEKQVAEACGQARRSRDSVCLVAVSKTFPIEDIEAAYQLGQTDFGENYVQEASVKIESLSKLDIRWHFIGRLQKNKVRQVVGKYQLIHTLDSLALAQKISQVAVEFEIIQSVLLQVNIAKEETKTGFTVEELERDFNQIMELPGLQVRGLMTMPPLALSNKSAPTNYFSQLRELLDKLKKQLSSIQQQSFCELSMGTSHDFSLAIQEGASIIRVGTAIFGDRG